jgi:hypothetical protein
MNDDAFVGGGGKDGAGKAAEEAAQGGNRGGADDADAPDPIAATQRDIHKQRVAVSSFRAQGSKILHLESGRGWRT